MKENKLKRLIRKILEAAVPQTNYEDKKIHPTQKPLKIVERFIELSTNQGDIVIDPFCGGGTTAAAFYYFGRAFSSFISFIISEFPILKPPFIFIFWGGWASPFI